MEKAIATVLQFSPNELQQVAVRRALMFHIKVQFMKIYPGEAHGHLCLVAMVTQSTKIWIKSKISMLHRLVLIFL